MEKEMIEKEIRRLIKKDAGTGPGTQRLIDLIVNDIMEGKRGLTFDPEQGRLIFFYMPLKEVIISSKEIIELEKAEKRAKELGVIPIENPDAVGTCDHCKRKGLPLKRYRYGKELLCGDCYVERLLY